MAAKAKQGSSAGDGAGWLEIVRGGRRSRHELGGRPLAIGGPGADVVFEGSAGTLSVSGAPPRVVHDGRGAPPTLAGRALADAALVDGDRLEWGDATLVFRAGPDEGPDVARGARGSPLLEEVPLEPAAAAVAGAQRVAGGRAARLVAAGVTVELGLADAGVVRRWQEAVRGGEYDAERAAHEILSSGRPLERERLDDRCAMLLRDFVMSSTLTGARGTARRARRAAKTGVAIFVSQAIAILVYTFLLVLCAVLVRYKWNVGFDRWVDVLLGRG